MIFQNRSSSAHTDSMEQSPSWVADSRSDSQEIPSFKEPEGPMLCSQQPAIGPSSRRIQ
jgi:hypothetical protein